jgi:hypothetical protein
VKDGDRLKVVIAELVVGVTDPDAFDSTTGPFALGELLTTTCTFAISTPATPK